MEKPEKPQKLKTRQKFSALDIRGMVGDLSSQLVGTKVHNIYDAFSRTYIFKFSKSGTKVNLIMESGVRFHTIEAFPDKNDKPNGFAMKLRKHLKGLFFESVEQIGVERVVRFKFVGADVNNLDYTFYIILELYAKGNIVLLDGRNTVLALLRSHKFDEEHRTALKEIYPMHMAAQYYFQDLGDIEARFNALPDATTLTHAQLISKLVPCAHQALADWQLSRAGLSPAAKFVASARPALLEAARATLDCFDPAKPLEAGGYMYTAKGAAKAFEFSPVRLGSAAPIWSGVEERSSASFDECVRLFFAQFAQADDEAAQDERIEREAMKKFNKIQEDQQKRLAAIREEVELSTLRARAVEQHSVELTALFNVA